MEYQGIITGIGDLNEHINEITPDIDAKLYDFILNRNAILDGFEISNGYLNGGLLVYKGYRCKYKGEPISLTGNPPYINGIIRTNSNGNVSEFYVETSDSAGGSPNIPTAPNSGIHFTLFVYSSGYELAGSFKDNQLVDYSYPAKAFESDEADFLKANGEIAETATTPTASVNAHNTTPLRVANTEYVHNQIEKEIDSLSIDNGEIRGIVGSQEVPIGTYSIKRKAKMAILTFSIRDSFYDSYKLVDFPQSCLPKTNIDFYATNNLYAVAAFRFSTTGTVTKLDNTVSNMLMVYNPTYIGYETN